MNNEYTPNYDSSPDYQVLENGTVVKRGDDGIYRPITKERSYVEKNDKSDYQPQGPVKKENPNHPPKTKFTKFVIGSMVVGLCTVPIAAHVAIENNTNNAMDAIKPGADNPLSPGDLFHDLGKTADALTLKPIRTMLGEK